MADTLPNWYARKFSTEVTVLSAQMDSRLMRTVRSDPDDMEAERAYYDRVGHVEFQQNTNGFGDTEWSYPAHSRRRIALVDHDVSIPISKPRWRRILAAGRVPDNYRRIVVGAYNRSRDDLIIAALGGNAIAVDSALAETTVALPSTQKVAAASAGLTLAKLQATKKILDANEVDDGSTMEERFFLLGSVQLDTDLLGITQLTSADYNTVKALVRGEVDTFMGFTFIRTERLPLSGSTRSCYAYVRSGMGWANGQQLEIDIGMRRDKKNLTQIYGDYSGGATRIEDEKVVEISCIES